MEERLQDGIDARSHIIDHAARMIGFAAERHRERFLSLVDLLFAQVEGWLPPFRDNIENAQRILAQLDPDRVLARGFSIVRSGDGVVKDVSKLEKGMPVEVQLARGRFDADITSIGKI